MNSTSLAMEVVRTWGHHVLFTVYISSRISIQSRTVDIDNPTLMIVDCSSLEVEFPYSVVRETFGGVLMTVRTLLAELLSKVVSLMVRTPSL